MGKFYSQNGEDVLLNEIFKGKSDGYFVEVGCIDGRRFSNTLHFEEKGWKGLCIEAHQDFIEDLIKNRPNSTIVPCAVSAEDKESVTFYSNKRGSLSTLDKTQEDLFREKYKDYFHGFVPQEVEQRSLNTIFQENGVGKIDLMSLDIEGHEIEALKGLDLKKYSPTVMVVETESTKQTNEIIAMMEGYHFIMNFNGNLFFSKDSSHADLIKNKKIEDVELIQTKHPFDDFEEKIFNYNDINNNLILGK